MLKYVNLFICLLVFLLSDATIWECSDKPGTCPPISVSCDLPLPLLQRDIPPCNDCDNNCKSTYKCCESSCYSYKICLPSNPITTINDNALETNVKESPLNDIDDNIKKIFKQVQDSISSDKELKQLTNYQENAVQGQKENEAAPNVKVNVFFNIIKKYYIQNLNVYKGGDKTVDGEDKITNEVTTPSETNKNSEDTNTTNDTWCGTIHIRGEDCLDDEDCVTPESSGSELEPLEEQPSNTITTETSEYTTKTTDPTRNVTTRPEIPGCQDDEDCHSTESSGINFEGSGSGLSPDESDSWEDHYSGNDHLLFEGSAEIQLPKIPTIATKIKTLDGTHYLFIDEEVQVVNDAGVTFDVETEIEF